MKLKAIYCVNIILTLIVLIGNYFYQDQGFYYPLKMLCSASFGLMGILNFIYMLHSKTTNRKLLLFLLLGILFSWGGDIVLNIDFVSGAAVFALGHVFFVIAFFISDLMLLLAWFSTVTGWTSHMCMALYYPAMCFFAVTLLNPRLE